MKRRNTYPKAIVLPILNFKMCKTLSVFWVLSSETGRKNISELKNMECCLSGKGLQTQANGPGALVFICKQNIRLLECCDLLLVSCRNSRGHRNKVIPELAVEKERKWPWFPEDLSEKQTRNPYRISNKVFRLGSLEQYQRDLEDWVYFALLKDQIDTAGLNFCIANIYGGLIKLYSATWLI